MKFRKLMFFLFLFVCALPLGSVTAQEAQRPLTNADIINMAKSGIGEQTIILTIQKAATKFDTSPEALIQLKTAGVTDAVLNAVLTASSSGPTAVNANQQDCAPLLDEVVASFGAREKLMAIRSLKWKGKQTVDGPSGRSIFSMERVTAFPSSIYVFRQLSTGQSMKLVITPEFNYLASGKVTTGVPASTLQELNSGMKLDLVYIAQHREQYSCISQGTEQIGNLRTAKLKITGEGVEEIWNIDPSTSRLMRTTRMTASSGQSVTEFTDWREVDGVYVPFGRHGIAAGVTTDVTIDEYEVNPILDVSLFQPPVGQVAASVTLKVLQSESVPYTVQQTVEYRPSVISRVRQTHR